MKISEILWKAANEKLWNGVDDRQEDERAWRFSCDAVAHALGKRDAPYPEAYDSEVFEFLRELGCPTGALDAFGDTDADEKGEYQQVRYQWLMFAALIAEEEGI